MQERVWALGGLWHSGPAHAHATGERPGWELRASLPLPAASTDDPRPHA
jgi:hypothetical protein